MLLAKSLCGYRSLITGSRTRMPLSVLVSRDIVNGSDGDIDGDGFALSKICVSVCVCVFVQRENGLPSMRCSLQQKRLIRCYFFVLFVDYACRIS